MKRYETIMIVDPDITEEMRTQIFDRSKGLVEKFEGFLAKFDEWGVKKLAYEIKRKPRGYYTCMDYCGPSELVNELERSMRLDEKVLKFMTILLDDQVNLDALKEELTQEPAEEAAAEEATTEEAPAAEVAAEEAPAVEVAAEEAPAEEPVKEIVEEDK